MLFQHVGIEPVLLFDNVVNEILGLSRVCVGDTTEQNIWEVVIDFDMQCPSKTCARRPDGLGWNLNTLPASQLADGFANFCLAEIQCEMNFFPLLHQEVAPLGLALARVIEAMLLSTFP